MTQENPTTKPAPSADAATNPENFLPQSTILIVDDNAQNVELLQAFLESLPVKIAVAVDGLDALRKVEEHHPDLILLDIKYDRFLTVELYTHTENPQDAAEKSFRFLSRHFG